MREADERRGTRGNRPSAPSGVEHSTATPMHKHIHVSTPNTALVEVAPQT